MRVKVGIISLLLFSTSFGPAFACSKSFGDTYEDADLNQIFQELENDGNPLPRLAQLGTGYGSNPISLALLGWRQAEIGEHFRALGYYDAAVFVISEKRICGAGELLFLISSLRKKSIEAVSDNPSRQHYFSLTQGFASHTLEVLSQDSERALTCLRSVKLNDANGEMIFQCGD